MAIPREKHSPIREETVTDAGATAATGGEKILLDADWDADYNYHQVWRADITLIHQGIDGNDVAANNTVYILATDEDGLPTHTPWKFDNTATTDDPYLMIDMPAPHTLFLTCASGKSAKIYVKYSIRVLGPRK